MKQFDYKVQGEAGIHARPAGMLVKSAKKFESKISIIKASQMADLKGLLSIMGLNVLQGDEITVMAEGTDEEQAIDEVKKILKRIDGGDPKRWKNE